jgi:hypothetical protein
VRTNVQRVGLKQRGMIGVFSTHLVFVVFVVFFVFVALVVLWAKMSQTGAAPMLAKTYFIALIVFFIIVEHVVVMDHRFKISREMDVHILIFASRHGNTEYRLIS